MAVCASAAMLKASISWLRSVCGCLPSSIAGAATTFLQMSSAARRFPQTSARLPTLHCRRPTCPLPCGPGPDSAQPCSALSVVRYSSLRCLCAAPLLPACPWSVCASGAAIVLHSGAHCPCRRRSFQVKPASWLLYVSPTTPFGVFTSGQPAAQSALPWTRSLVFDTFCAPCHAKLEESGAD